MIKKIIKELKEHAPFTALGVVCGIVFLVVFRNIEQRSAQDLFYVFHPIHVLLSALATASMYRIYACPKEKGKCNLFMLLLVGYIGAIGIATLSDSIMPYLGEIILGMEPVHAHIGFIEKPWLINGIAIVGIVIAYFNPSTKFPHAGHVLISTWASLFHVLMVMGSGVSYLVYLGIFTFLFLAVWLPCCISDIVFPLLFVRADNKQ